MIQKRVPCKPSEINPAGEQGLSKTPAETQGNTGDAFSFSVNQKKKIKLKKKIELQHRMKGRLNETDRPCSPSGNVRNIVFIFSLLPSL